MGAIRQRVTARASTRVMLVEDSAVVRGMVRKWLGDVPGIEVVATAVNGQVAIESVAAAAPDLIILDIEMPVMDGITALPSLLRLAPGAKILMASTLTHRNAQVSLKALQLGATDYVTKPSFAKDGNEARDAFRDELVRKIEALSGAPTQVCAGRSSPSTSKSWSVMPKAGDQFTLRRASRLAPRILAFGSSTGGPQALTKVFEALKGRLERVPVVVAQHMPPTFTKLLADKLATSAGLRGGEAEDGQEVLPGHLYLAPGGFHMTLVRAGSGTKIALDRGPAINHCRPAVDPLFDSIAYLYGASALSVVMTGMGSDGAQGALKIADAGGSVLVQDEATSVVWGMPGATAQAGAASEILPLENIATRVGGLVGSRRA